MLFEEYVTGGQIAEKLRVKQKEGKQFSRMRFLSVRSVSLFFQCWHSFAMILFGLEQTIACYITLCGFNLGPHG